MGARPPVSIARRQPLSEEVTGTSDIAPEVRAQLATQKERQEQAKRDKEEREAEAKRERERQKARARNEQRKGKRVSVDLPEEVIKALQYIGRKEDVAQGDLIALALTDWLEDYKAGHVELEPLKRPARSLRITYSLALPEFALPSEWE